MRFKFLYLLVFCVASMQLFAQNEVSFNDLLSVCKKAKTETEDNVRSIKQFWKVEDPKYFEATRLFNNARAEFEGWIDFYKSETTDAINNKKYTVDEQKLRSKIDEALNAVNKFNSFYYNADNSNSSIAKNADPITPILNIASCFDSALNTLKYISSSKKEKRDALKKELDEKLERYHLLVFNEIK
ncbi:MAG TPA: hypothetical protein VJY62_02095 [Bacteroidia bacterium]|nr:hypothetical protein [Bacteroidia bacterium]